MTNNRQVTKNRQTVSQSDESEEGGISSRKGRVLLLLLFQGLSAWFVVKHAQMRSRNWERNSKLTSKLQMFDDQLFFLLFECHTVNAFH